MNCKCDSPELWKGATGAVFSNLLVLDYYDGPTTAICECALCGLPLLVSLLSWKPELSRIRIFGAARISPQQFTDIKNQTVAQDRMLAGGEADPYSDFEFALSRLVGESGSPYAVLAAVDLNRQIIAARQISDPGVGFEISIERVPEADFGKWLSYLAITTEGAASF